MQVSLIQYFTKRLGDDLWDYVIYYWSMGLVTVFLGVWLAVLAGLVEPLLGFSRFGLSFLFACLFPLLAIAFSNFRLEFDLVSMKDGRSALSDAIFIGMATALNLMYTYGVFTEVAHTIFIASHEGGSNCFAIRA